MIFKLCIFVFMYAKNVKLFMMAAVSKVLLLVYLAVGVEFIRLTRNRRMVLCSFGNV